MFDGLPELCAAAGFIFFSHGSRFYLSLGYLCIVGLRIALPRGVLHLLFTEKLIFVKMNSTSLVSRTLWLRSWKPFSSSASSAFSYLEGVSG